MFPLMAKFLLSVVAFESLAVGSHVKKNSEEDDPPCLFNPLCTCSKAYPDLGRVTCKNVPLITIPQQIKTSKVFTLHLESNGLRYIEPQFFKETGLLKIEISQNFLTDISEETFSGLGRSLWELNLQHNRFRRVPNQSFRYLKKLKLLDLSGNEIVHIKAEDWLGLEDSLKSLILSGNKVSALRPRTFSILQQLESLDLSGNALFEIDAFAFKDGPPLLKELNLADNLLSSIPFQELSELRELRHLDLSFNLIKEIQDSLYDRSKANPSNSNLVLDTLRLDYNAIQHLPAGSFSTFSKLNQTYLNGNPIVSIEKGAFERSKIRELHLADCEISDLTLDSFFGLENSLEVLNLEGNNLTTLPFYLFKNFDLVKSLNLENNFFKQIDPDKLFDGYQSSLLELFLGGEQNPFVDFQNAQTLPNLRLLALSKLPQPTLSSNDLPDFFSELEEIKISHSNIKTIKSHAFKNVRRLRKLDLSENSISVLEESAFFEVGHTLVHLSLSNGLSSDVAQLPPNIFENLTSLKHLDLSDNGIKVLTPKLLRSVKQLETILLQDNFIEFIPKRAFQSQVHTELNTIQLSFNQLSSIENQAFSSLNKLQYLWLSDNKITSMERGAFLNLERLRHLYLRGNRLSFLNEETFQDLPALEKLDLAYNKLRTFGYGSLEQINTLSSFTLNVSHNNIEDLRINASYSPQTNDGELLVNVKALDLSYNNISYIEAGFFAPVESSITHLYLSHNKLLNVTQNVFGHMMHLQWLDISNNLLKELDYNSFAKTKNVQVLHLGNNRLEGIPKQIFKNFNRLRILDLGTNNLRTLPENLFSDTVIQWLDLSDNQLTTFPVTSFDMDSASDLTELNMSQNAVAALPPPEVFAIFQNLYSLDLSKNRIVRIEDGTFAYLRRLHILDLSCNTHLTLNSKGATFHGLENVLQELVLKNLSLTELPALRLHSLINLDVSDNDIVAIPFELAHNVTKMEKLELSGNEIKTIPPAINALTRLKYLGISRNPLEEVNFQQSVYLRELDLRNISLSSLQKGALGKLPLLESLKLSFNRNIENFNLPYFLKNNQGLNSLLIEVLQDECFTEEKLKGFLPPKLQNLTLRGLGLKTIPKNLFEGIRSPRMNLIISNTSVERIPGEVFHNGKKIRNLTLDLRLNKLKLVYNPNSGDSPNTPKKTFLLDLKISNNDWTCDCAIGWIEGWERKRRHYLCEDSSEECYLVSDDLRSAVCNNRKPLIEVFKQELECDWNSSKSLTSSLELVFVLVSFSLLVFGF